MNEQVKPKPLIIAGPQGSGKTTKAREIAVAAGTVAEIAWCDLSAPFDLGNIFGGDDKPKTLIVDEMPATPEAMAQAAKLAGAADWMLNRKYQEPVRVPAPALIFCTTGSVDFLHDAVRRFSVIEL